MGEIRSPRYLFLIMISIFLLSPTSNSQEQDDLKKSLVHFMEKLSGGNRAISKRWNMTSEPCQWGGVSCYPPEDGAIWEINLEGKNLSGTFDAASVCKARSLLSLKLTNNNLTGSIPAEIVNCTNLIFLLLSQNRFSGSVPSSVASLLGLMSLEISDNRLTGEVPDLSRLLFLHEFRAQNNRLSGLLPRMNFVSLQDFNVSNNDFQGRIPLLAGKFGADSFLGNPGLCGPPLPNRCSGVWPPEVEPANPPPVDPSTATPVNPPPSIDPSTVDISGGIAVQANGIVILLWLLLLLV